MSIDLPTVVYDDGSPKTPTRKQMDDLADRWNEQKKKNPFKKGEKVNLNDYLNNKI